VTQPSAPRSTRGAIHRARNWRPSASPRERALSSCVGNCYARRCGGVGPAGSPKAHTFVPLAAQASCRQVGVFRTSAS